jgi:two-component system response regulator DesR
MIRVLIVDGQDQVRRGLRMRLDVEPDVEIVAETGKAGEALYLAQALEPDVIVVDIEMRGAEGVTLVERLRAANPEAAVVVLTLHGDKVTRARSEQAGAHAFLEKHGGAADLVKTMRLLTQYRVPSATLHGPASRTTAEHALGMERNAGTPRLSEAGASSSGS